MVFVLAAYVVLHNPYRQQLTQQVAGVCVMGSVVLAFRIWLAVCIQECDRILAELCLYAYFA